jgi:hypothetical protein
MSPPARDVLYPDATVTVLAVARPPSELRRIVMASAGTALVFGLFYLAFLFVHQSFPYIRSGADVVARFKHGLASTGQPFRTQGLHVMIFGNSKVLSGFLPSLFDREMAQLGVPDVESFNFGIPADDRFVADLDKLLARGAAPDVVLLTIPWPAAGQRTSVFRFIDNDQEIIERLFPFRKLWRDLFLLAAESRGRPDLVRRIYQDNERTVARVGADRGFYFIARQSHYSNDALPPRLGLPTDMPHTIVPRIVPRSPILDRLSRTFASHKIRCLFVPMYFREGELAPAPAVNAESVRTLAGYPAITVSGPDYFLYPNSLFSDFIHTNPRGAAVYTRDLARLLARHLRP